jgi:hypothetical protein
LQLPEESGLVDVVDEGSLAVDFEDRQPFAVPRLEPRVAGDVDDLVLHAQPPELLLGAVAEAAALRREEDEPRDRDRA